MKITKSHLRRLIREEFSRISESKVHLPGEFGSTQDISDEDIYTLTRNTGENYIEQFEGSLMNILGDLVPEMSDEAKSRILRNSSEHQRNLQSLVNRSYSVEGAGRKFISGLIDMAIRLN
tara:strand:+ start:96 stop:455 length:360 start_codon:yes stop_codon:yes gene_type:complete